ncbi:MAG: 4a-hydroxytetrahydrobiopterin dehydratase [Anaerolineae bacterium]
MTQHDKLAALISAEEASMSVQEVENALKHLSDWQLLKDETNGYQLRRDYHFDTAQQVISFVEHLEGLRAEQPEHVMFRALGKAVTVTCATADMMGLDRHDFLIAAQVDDLFARRELISGERDRVTQASDESFPASDPPAH